MIKALLIGCGNIGAGYDLNDENKVWTHAKAYAKTGCVALTVFDTDEEKANAIAAKYKAQRLTALDDEVFRAFDIISITTPTPTHFQYLSTALMVHTPVVICEKPVVSSSAEASQLADLYQAGKSKVLVNYIRRFQPGYRWAKAKLAAIQQQQGLKAIAIKYKRGFLNNASHAVDLLEFLWDQPFHFENFQYSFAAFDAFDYDPTLTASCVYQNIPVSFVGVPQAGYAIFEMELFLPSSKMVICHSGNEIRYYQEVNGGLTEAMNERQTDLLDTYMLPVIERAVACVQNKNTEDNFIGSLHLNNEMLKIVELIKSKQNATISY